jgi:hypothetical protein
VRPSRYHPQINVLTVPLRSSEAYGIMETLSRKFMDQG